MSLGKIIDRTLITIGTVGIIYGMSCAINKPNYLEEISRRNNLSNVNHVYELRDPELIKEWQSKFYKGLFGGLAFVISSGTLFAMGLIRESNRRRKERK